MLLSIVVVLMDVKMWTVGALLTNCYVVWCGESREAVVVDPGFDRQSDGETLLGFLNAKGLHVKGIVNTHGHPDHVCGNGFVKDVTGARILIHKSDADMLSVSGRGIAALFGFRAESPAADGFLADGDSLRLGDVCLGVLHTPGHSRGSIALVGNGCVFTGDTLFAGSVGRVDLPGGSGEKLLRSLREKLAVLPDDFVIYPGHGGTSTIGKEKRCNPFLQEGADAFLLG